MPIMIPTGAEIERMNHRTRVLLAKRLRAIRRELAESLATLAINGLDPFPSRRAVTMATARAAGSHEADEARRLLALMPPDPDAAQHAADLLKAIA